MCEYIYLLKEREFIKTNEDIFKIGKTKQENLTRLVNYPNGSQLIIQMKCENCDKTERILITLFTQKFKRRKDIGFEYFEGNYHEMIRYIFEEIEGKQSDEKNEEVYIIDTYMKLKKISDIGQIIIIDKNTQSGFAKVSISSDNSYKLFTFGNKGKDDDLINFIENRMKDISLCRSNITKEIVVMNKVMKLRNFEKNYTNCNYIIDYDKLIKDVCVITYDPLYFDNSLSEESDKNEGSMAKPYMLYAIYIYVLIICTFLYN